VLRDNLTQVRERIRQACERAGRDPGSVTLVAVTKGLPVETIREAAALGITDVGENRVQEAAAKIDGWSGGALRWHLIGHLQRNKAKDAVELFGAIHSVDSLALADELERQAAKRARSLDVFVQVNVSGETTKFGCRPEEASALARHLAGQPHLRLKGFMTMAPFGADPELARPAFRELRLLRDTIQASGLLSMGMSHDFEVAIEEGADLVRIGTAIFGARA
jgi:pyridoxal phosphate enzyme (YggS family)